MRSFHGWIYNESKEWEKLRAGDGKARSVSPVLSFPLLRKCSCKRDIFQVVSLLCSACCIVPGRIDMISLDGFFLGRKCLWWCFEVKVLSLRSPTPTAPLTSSPLPFLSWTQEYPSVRRGSLPVCRLSGHCPLTPLFPWQTEEKKKTLNSLNEHVCVYLAMRTILCS